LHNRVSSKDGSRLSSGLICFCLFCQEIVKSLASDVAGIPMYINKDVAM
jgi:hypothetical protein